MDKVCMGLEVGRINKRLETLREWREQLEEKIRQLEDHKANLIEQMESQP